MFPFPFISFDSTEETQSRASIQFNKSPENLTSDKLGRGCLFLFLILFVYLFVCGKVRGRKVYFNMNGNTDNLYITTLWMQITLHSKEKTKAKANKQKQTKKKTKTKTKTKKRTSAHVWPEELNRDFSVSSNWMFW